MNFFTQLFADSDKASKFLKIGMLMPMLIPYVKAFEDVYTDGPEKKRSVLEALNLTTDLLEKHGYLSKAYNDGLDKIASELIDVIVEVFNTTGVFAHDDKKKKKEIEEEETEKPAAVRTGPGAGAHHPARKK